MKLAFNEHDREYSKVTQLAMPQPFYKWQQLSIQYKWPDQDVHALLIHEGVLGKFYL